MIDVDITYNALAVRRDSLVPVSLAVLLLLDLLVLDALGIIGAALIVCHTSVSFLCTGFPRDSSDLSHDFIAANLQSLSDVFKIALIDRRKGWKTPVRD